MCNVQVFSFIMALPFGIVGIQLEEGSQGLVLIGRGRGEGKGGLATTQLVFSFFFLYCIYNDLG